MAYADAAPGYRAAGWSGVLPLPAGAKQPPPMGHTGRNAPMPDDARVTRWAQAHPDGNVALRPGRGVLGLDLDLYKEPGARAALEQVISGELPPTWVSTSREDGSGIYWYRVDPPAPGQRWAANPVPGCEVIQHGHRYAVAPPSKHPEGRVYVWLEHGARVEDGRVPCPDELPALPLAAQAALREDRSGVVRDAVPFELTEGAPDRPVTAKRDEALAACQQPGSRYDAVRDAVASLARMAEQGRPGVGPALRAVGDAFVAAVDGDRGGRGEAEREWQRLAEGALKLVATTALDRPASPSSHGIQLLGAADLFAIEQHEPDWLVEPLFERSRLSAVVGAAKSGKSLVVQEVALALAAGRGVLGQPPRAPVTTLYLDDENTPVDWASRLRAFGYTPADQLPGLHVASFPNLALTDPRDAKRLVALADELRPDLVVLDTASRFVRGNENDADTWQSLYRECLVLLKAMGCAVVRIDHLGKDEAKGARGSSAKNEDVDSVWQLKASGDGQWIWLERTHTRQGYGAPALTLRRLGDPLRHELAAPDEEPTFEQMKVGELLAALDACGVPPTAGRPTAQRALREAGFQFKGELLAEALRVRKSRGQSALPGMEEPR